MLSLIRRRMLESKRLPAGYQEVEYIYKPDNFLNPNFGLGIIAYGNKYGLEVKMQASQEDMDYAMAGNQLQVCGYYGLAWNDKLPYQNVCQIYIRQDGGYYLGRQVNSGWYTKPDGTITSNSSPKILLKPCDTDIHIVSTYYDSESDRINTYLDGMLKDATSSKSWENDLTAGTEYFVYGNRSSGGYSFKGRIYYIKTFDPDRKMTGYFLPCVRKSDGRAGLYDVVNSVFKTSAYDYIKAGPIPGQELPYGYQEVEWLECWNGEQYIDTGYTTLLDGDRVALWEGKAGFSSNYTGRSFVAAFNRASYTHFCEFYQSYFGNIQRHIDIASVVDELYDVSAKFIGEQGYEYTQIIDGSKQTLSQGYSMSVQEDTFYLFRLLAGYKGTGIRIGRNKLTVDGVLVRDYIPVVKDNVGYMYDKVQQKLYANAGSGSFVVGPNV